MRRYRQFNARIGRLIDAFDMDGYEIKRMEARSGNVGIMAEHKNCRQLRFGE